MLNYDVIIIGDQLAGLMCALLSIRYSKSILLIRIKDQVPLIEKNGYRFDLDAPIMSGFGKNGIFSRIFGEIGMMETELKKFHRPDPAWQYIQPKCRTDVSVSFDQAITTLQRLFPADQAKLIPFFNEVKLFDDFLRIMLELDIKIPAVSFYERIKLDKEINKHAHATRRTREYNTLAEMMTHFQLSRELQNFIFQLIFALSSAAPATISDNAGAYLLGLFWNGFYSNVSGDTRYIAQFSEKRFKALHGTILDADDIADIEIESASRIAKIRLTDQRELLCSNHYYVWNAGISRLINIFVHKRHGEAYAKKLLAIKPQYVKFTVQWVIDNNVIPVGMGTNLIVTPLIFPVPSIDPFMVLNLAPIPLPQQPPSGENKLIQLPDKSFLSATAYLPLVDKKIFEKETLKTIADVMWKEIRRIIPFLDDFLLAEAVDEICSYYARGNFSPKHLHYSFDMEDRLRLANISDETPFKNFLLTGLEIFPGLGYESHAYSAWNCANLIYDKISNE
jgi:hypothetical protein